MKPGSKILVTLALLLTTAGATRGAEVYVAHGINGADLGTAAELPVDVVVDGACFLTGFTFGTFAGPVELPGGSYDIEVKLGDGACGGATAVGGTVAIKDNERVTLMAHLADDGSPSLAKFRNPVSRVRDGYGRLEIRHAANAPAVDIELRRKGGEVAFSSLANGGSDTAELSSRAWRTRIYAATGSDVVVGPVKIRPRAGRVTIIYAVGSLDNGTFGFLAQELAAHTDAP